MELFKAHNQWATRPDDERFDSLKSLYDATKKYYISAKEKNVPFSDIRVEASKDDVQLVGKAGVPAKLTHWAFGQLAGHVGAPASYLRTLPATLACQNLNHGLLKRTMNTAANKTASLLFHLNGGLLLRALTTDSYKRIWNWEVAERLVELEGQGWTPARPTIRQFTKHKSDCPLNNQSMKDAPETDCRCPENLPLYASDHDMFAFLSNNDLTIKEKGSDGAMYKGIMVENSEVGASSFKLTRFLYRDMCGNHIVWGASQVMDLRIRHVGKAHKRMGIFLAQVRKYADESVSDIEAKIAKAKSTLIADTKEAVLDAVFGKKISGLSRKDAESGYDATVEGEDGSANSVWGFAQGVTRFSQTIPYADKRTELDRAAGKMIDSFVF